MPVFGGGGRRARDELELRAELARLDVLSPDELADEVLVRLFGADGPVEKDGTVPLWRIVQPFDPHRTGLFPGMPKDLRRAFTELVEEGVQRLEHRELVYLRISGRDQTDADLRLTRAGRRALGEDEGP